MKLGLFGFGKMGKAIASVAKQEGIDIVGVLESADSPILGKDLKEMGFDFCIKITDNPKEFIVLTDVVLDFSTPQATLENIVYPQQAKKPIVIGTTGFSQEEIEFFIKQVSKQIPLFLSFNFSFGVNVFYRILEEALRYLKDWDIEVLEIHHNQKKDAPSGTAKEILKRIEKYKNFQIREKRWGEAKRIKEEVGVFAIRGGDVVGEHFVYLFGSSESIELTHRAYSREVFAKGALKAVKFIKDKHPGFYSMDDLLSSILL